jgi:hypothetical protein
MRGLPLPNDVPMCWASAAIRTLHAPRWKVMLAKWFGRRFVGQDGSHTIIGHEWRGKFYLTDYRVDT